jgi:hypothetical protein
MTDGSSRATRRHDQGRGPGARTREGAARAVAQGGTAGKGGDPHVRPSTYRKSPSHHHRVVETLEELECPVQDGPGLPRQGLRGVHDRRRLPASHDRGTLEEDRRRARRRERGGTPRAWRLRYFFEELVKDDVIEYNPLAVARTRDWATRRSVRAPQEGEHSQARSTTSALVSCSPTTPPRA